MSDTARRYNRDKSKPEYKRGDRGDFDGTKYEDEERERDQRFAPPIPNLSQSKWNNNHRRAGCTRNCVTDRSHFNLWRDTYNGDLVDFHSMITIKTKTDIPFEDFVYFAYSQSSGYVSPYIKNN